MIHIHSQALNFVYYNFLKLWWGIKHKTNTTRTKLTWMLKSRDWNDKRKNLGKKMTIQGWNLDFSQFCKLKKKNEYISWPFLSSIIIIIFLNTYLKNEKSLLRDGLVCWLLTELLQGEIGLSNRFEVCTELVYAPLWSSDGKW